MAPDVAGSSPVIHPTFPSGSRLVRAGSVISGYGSAVHFQISGLPAGKLFENLRPDVLCAGAGARANHQRRGIVAADLQRPAIAALFLRDRDRRFTGSEFAQRELRDSFQVTELHLGDRLTIAHCPANR